MGIKILGVFNETPRGIFSFGGVQVHDFREEKSNTALWAVMENSIVETMLVLLPPPDGGKAIGRYAEGAAYLKWNLSVNVHEDVRMAVWWPGDDVSRTGHHGTQCYAYLATDLNGQAEFRLAGGASRGSSGMDDFHKEDSKFPYPRPGYGMEKEWHGVNMSYRSGFSFEAGTSPDHMRKTYGRAPPRWGISMDGKSTGAEGEWNYYQIAQAIRDNFPNRSMELDEALLSEDIIQSKEGNRYHMDVVGSLVQFYLDGGLAEPHLRFSDYAERKREEEELLSVGEEFEFSGHFRRMGMSGNCDMWVIAEDGSLRECDELERRKMYEEGGKRWKRVGPSELAIQWRAGTMRAVAETSECSVWHAPVGGCTAEQFAAVREIEREIGLVLGAFKLSARKPEPQGVGVPASDEELAKLAKRFGK